MILSNIGADTLLLHPDTFERGQRTPDRIALLAQYTAAGHGLLMVGGYLYFSGFEGKARYQNTALAGVLPVTMLGFDDRVETPAGVIPTECLEHPVLDGLSTAWPSLLGYNRLLAKPDSQVLLSFEDDPLLIVGQYGQGRVAAFASDCSAHWGGPDSLPGRTTAVSGPSLRAG